MKIALFAASSSKVGKVYLDAARETGSLLAESGHHIVYGGGDTGLMGALADRVIEMNGEITGVIPGFMISNGWNHKGVDNMIITTGMSSRKEKIFEIADAVIALPGGIGTLEELTEAITLKQLGQFNGPVVILNISRFYDHLLTFLDHLSGNGFMGKDHSRLWSVASSPGEALEIVETYAGWDDNWVHLARI